MTRPTARLPAESPATRTSQVFRRRAKGRLGTARLPCRSSTPATTTGNHHPR